jgi:hypothetical protein
MRSFASFLLGRIAFAALACVLVIAGCAAIELGYRIHTGRPVLSLANWRAWRIEYLTFGDRGKFDPVLGWVTRDWYADEGYNTVAHGIRRNPREQDVQIAPGAILAVGGGFTDGGENVDDDETWPAQLERLLGTRVLNAGVPGYVADQIVLRAEQLLAQLRPKTLVLGFVGDEIPRARLSSFGVSKPYFTLENGALVFHPPHRPYMAPDPTMPVWQARVRELLGYSAVLDVVLDLVASGYWIGTAGQPVVESVDNDPVGVTCALLQRLKRQADAAGVRLLLFMQHGRIVLTLKEAPQEDASKVTQCAAAAGIEVVDQFRPLRALAVSDLAAFRGLYLKRALSPKGNRQAAEMLVRAIDRSAKAPPSAAVAPPAGVKKQ